MVALGKGDGLAGRDWVAAKAHNPPLDAANWHLELHGVNMDDGHLFRKDTSATGELRGDFRPVRPQSLQELIQRCPSTEPPPQRWLRCRNRTA